MGDTRYRSQKDSKGTSAYRLAASLVCGAGFVVFGRRRQLPRGFASLIGRGERGGVLRRRHVSSSLMMLVVKEIRVILEQSKRRRQSDEL